MRAWAGLCSLLLLTGLLAGCSSGPGDGSTTMPAGSLVALAVKNASAAGWVHETATTTGPGTSLQMTNDIGAREGRQVIDSNGGHSTVLVLHGTAYINGDSTALTHYFGLQVSDPQDLAGRWISIRTSDPGYPTVSAAVTLRSDFQNVISGPFSKSTTVVVDGETLTAVHGFTEGSSAVKGVPATLDVTQGRTVLPVRLHASAGRISETTTWSHWGRSVPLATPSQSIPISTLSGSDSATTT
jgi:hypothetical protein